MSSDLGSYIRQMREGKGWTLDQLGRKLGRPATWVSNLEVGRRKNLPEPEELRAVSRALGVTVPDLLEAAGYLTADDRQQVTANPFPRDDIRFRIVEELAALDLDGPDGPFLRMYLRLKLRDLKDFRQFGTGDVNPSDVVLAPETTQAG